jgi:hypothetical protein
MIKVLMEHLDKYATENKRLCNLGNLLHYFAFDVCPPFLSFSIC